MPNGRAAAPSAPKGPVAWVRQTIANRAAIRIDENFRGLENWGSGAKGNPAGWSRHADGYVNTGALALLRPTLKFTDYHMEFFGQIETKSIGWTVRATDTRNYHAMKLTVMEAGTAPSSPWYIQRWTANPIPDADAPYMVITTGPCSWPWIRAAVSSRPSTARK
jgi:hypothetical protein